MMEQGEWSIVSLHDINGGEEGGYIQSCYLILQLIDKK